jgi:hypothetical protein
MDAQVCTVDAIFICLFSKLSLAIGFLRVSGPGNLERPGIGDILS